ncbi:hypothetical protein QWM81_19180 [Streptomyces ficellus]|uniref:ATP-binding protein n=1 Tax=Streptomyces ficellus TaxID=1977088 RepID=A0ABT7Z9H2_9ACTN|nr:hypothetical protein [Streptomyces ficellus]MDN3296145.1 hypothetical protein [Streptomyces ficellus]
MKPTKVAAVVAGSVMALGAAAPAFAAETLTPSGLNGAVEPFGKPRLTEAVPTEAVTKATTDGKVVNKVKDAAKPLLGGVPLGK